MSRASGILFALAFVPFVACGGSTENGGAGASSGTGATGGSSTGGSSTGGSSTGGSSTGGHSTGGSGAIGGGGATGGMGGGAGAPGWTACNDTSECTLFATNCCNGYCSQVPLSAFVALNAKYESDYSNQFCLDGTSCPGCIAAPQPNFAALCRSGECTAVDLRTDELSACQSDADCTLRWGSGCCESCTPPLPTPQDGLTAVSKNANVSGALCGSVAPPCCAPAAYPPDALAVCIAGHCAVSYYIGG